MKTHFRFAIGQLFALLVALPVSAQWFGPSPYLSAADSPFASVSYSSYFHLENVEDGLINTPGLTITPSVGSVFIISPLTNPGFVDSVDGDDGVIDGSGLGGHSLYAPADFVVVNLNFNAGALGQLPADVGFVWTDGPTGTLTIKAFGSGNSLISAIVAPVGLTVNTPSGETVEDRFIGFRHLAGISRFEITVNQPYGMEFDHVQYGAAPVPEVSTYAAGLTLLGLIGWQCSRRVS